MTIDFHSFAGLYARALDTASHLLAKGAEHAAAVGVSEADMLDWRLIDDMAPDASGRADNENGHDMSPEVS